MIGGLLTGHPVKLSRNEPEFVNPRGTLPQSIRDRFVSRKPIRLVKLDDSTIEFSLKPGMHFRVDGRPVQDSMTIALSALDSGVLLELSHRVILILHLVSLTDRTESYNLVGESDGIRRVQEKIAQVADLDETVLIRGETGVGKERIAQAIHSASRRADRPCISVNMAAISPSTAVSELFGHARGSFTGALKEHPGLFQRADGGTLFLDEIGETPPNIQAMLLRTLAEGTLTAIGEQTERRVDVRIIAATDANIEEGGPDGTFRSALYHRLSGYEIRVAPLRERRDDIGRLAMYFLENELKKIGEAWRLEPMGPSRALWFPPALMIRLYRHDWSGNIRQLANVIRQLVISSRGAKELQVDESVERVLSEWPRAKSQLASQRPDSTLEPVGPIVHRPDNQRHGSAGTAFVDSGDAGLSEQTDELINPDESWTGPLFDEEDDEKTETQENLPTAPREGDSNPRPSPAEEESKPRRAVTPEQVYAALEACDWRQGAAAKRLGIPRSTLYNMTKKLAGVRQAKDITRPEIEQLLAEYDGDLDQVARKLKVSKRAIQLRMNQLDML